MPANPEYYIHVAPPKLKELCDNLDCPLRNKCALGKGYDRGPLNKRISGLAYRTADGTYQCIDFRAKG